MAKSLVVVESPAKAKTINKYLGKNYKVVASMGHVRDLPKSKLGVAIDEGFEPSYEVIASRKKVMTELKAAAKDATEIFVATDPDREGEAIGWHLAEELGAGNRKKIRRLMFNEITKKGVLAALDKPTQINKQMVDAQQARRVLDRLVGYKISPILWDKVRRGLSAGRVQSVALKIVVDREREIGAFVAEEYWNLTARLAGPVPPEFDAKLLKKDGANIKIGNEAESNAVLDDLTQAEWTVASVTTKERKKGAVPPFITSKLQQASRFPVKKTMMIAQQLYEGIELPGEGAVGLITYMRTDSTRVSDQAVTDVREHIGAKFGPDFVPEKPNAFKTKKDAQDAHEAIRPTSMQWEPDAVRAHLTADQYYLYRLIWNRFVASQMPPAIFDDTTVDIQASNYLFRVKGSVPKFAGWTAVYEREVAEVRTEGAGPDSVSGII
jgi:DNA topoisomerase-1